MADDYYQILGVSRNASEDEINKAYRKLAKIHHPDLSDDKEAAKEKFKKIQQAHDVLTDPKKKKLYDKYGDRFEQIPESAYDQASEMNFDGMFGGGGGAGGFEDILRQFSGGGFGGGGFSGDPFAQAQQPRRKARGRSIQKELAVPFSTAVLGGQAQVTVQRPSGKSEEITVKIPSGIESGKKIRLKGQGNPSVHGGQPGDILITVNVARHPSFRRNGLNLEVLVPVSFVEAALGAKVEIPTPHGTTVLSIPPNSSSGKRLRLRGLGIKGDKDGDLIVILSVVLPETIDEAAQETIRKLGEDLDFGDPRSDLAW